MTETSAKEDKQQKLREADQHIADAESRVARQVSLITELERDAHATQMAQALLETMRESLNQMYAHRRLIVTEMERER